MPLPLENEEELPWLLQMPITKGALSLGETSISALTTKLHRYPSPAPAPPPTTEAGGSSTHAYDLLQKCQPPRRPKIHVQVRGLLQASAVWWYAGAVHVHDGVFLTTQRLKAARMHSVDLYEVEVSS